MPLSNSENKKYLKEKERLLTFKSWPKEDIVKSAILAADGFIYLNEGDRVMCVFCQGVLRTWEPNDSPSEEHDRHFPHCPYVLGYDVGNIPLSCNYRRKPSLGKPPNIKIPKVSVRFCLVFIDIICVILLSCICVIVSVCVCICACVCVVIVFVHVCDCVCAFVCLHVCFCAFVYV